MNKNNLRAAYRIAQSHSPDPSTRVGAIITTKSRIFYGWNRVSPGLYNFDLTDRGLKYKIIEHAERDAIFKATKAGVSLLGATMYCPWAACCECARAIVLSGIKEVVCHGNALEKTPDRWRENIELAKKIFEAGNVTYTWWYGKLGFCKNLFDGEIWYP
jgi:dCMP deaminase